MTSKEFIESIGIDLEGTEIENGYEIILKDSNEYSRIYSKLDESNKLDLDPEEIIMSEHSNIMTYLADDFDVILEANFDSDLYKLTIKEI